jgi:hypothetical protein
MTWKNNTIIAFTVLAGGIGHAAPLLQHSAFNLQTSKTSKRFLKALAMVESCGNARVRPGDGGRAVGLYQIHDIYRREANRILGRQKYSSKDRLDPEKSEQMVRIVLTHWARYHARRGRKIGPAELCSLHRQPNGLWTPKRMQTRLERGRTRKLLKYLEG